METPPLHYSYLLPTCFTFTIFIYFSCITFIFYLFPPLLYKHKIKMSVRQKIDKQVHSASILICSNDKQKPFKSATWIRKFSASQKLLKKECFENSLQTIYHCSIFDVGSCIQLVLQNAEGRTKQFLYGPIRLDTKISTEYKINQWNITVILNKCQQFKGSIFFPKVDGQFVYIVIKLQEAQFQLVHTKKQNWIQFEEILSLSEVAPQSIFVEIGERNKMTFLKRIRKLKVFYHNGSCLELRFSSTFERDQYLRYFYQSILNCRWREEKLLFASEKNKRTGSGNIGGLDSTEIFSDPHSNGNINNISFQQDKRASFVPNDKKKQQQTKLINSSNKRTMQTEDIEGRSNKSFNLSTSKKIFKTNPQWFASSDMLVRQKGSSPVRSKQRHIKQKDRYVHKSERLNMQIIKSQEKLVASSKPTYEQLQKRNRILQSCNKQLLNQNIKLREELKILIEQKKNQKRDELREKSVPNFIKSRKFEKEQMKIPKLYRFTEMEDQSTTLQKLQNNNCKFTRKKGERISEGVFFRDSLGQNYCRSPQPFSLAESIRQ